MKISKELVSFTQGAVNILDDQEFSCIAITETAAEVHDRAIAMAYGKEWCHILEALVHELTGKRHPYTPLHKLHLHFAPHLYIETKSGSHILKCGDTKQILQPLRVDLLNAAAFNGIPGMREVLKRFCVNITKEA